MYSIFKPPILHHNTWLGWMGWIWKCFIHHEFLLFHCFLFCISSKTLWQLLPFLDNSLTNHHMIDQYFHFSHICEYFWWSFVQFICKPIIIIIFRYCSCTLLAWQFIRSTIKCICTNIYWFIKFMLTGENSKAGAISFFVMQLLMGWWSPFIRHYKGNFWTCFIS